MATSGAEALVVRDAGLGDEEAIAALLGELGYPSGPETLRARLERLGGNAGSWIWVAVEGELVVGTAALHVMPLLERGPLGRLTAILVAGDRRRLGIGRRLMERVEEQARAEGCERLELTSAERRQDAHAFYRELGFEEASRRFLKHL